MMMMKNKEGKCHAHKRVRLGSAIVTARGAYIYEKHKYNKQNREEAYCGH